jgi:hypothetical protein
MFMSSVSRSHTEQGVVIAWGNVEVSRRDATSDFRLIIQHMHVVSALFDAFTVDDNFEVTGKSRHLELPHRII